LRRGRIGMAATDLLPESKKTWTHCHTLWKGISQEWWQLSCFNHVAKALPGVAPSLVCYLDKGWIQMPIQKKRATSSPEMLWRPLEVTFLLWSAVTESAISGLQYNKFLELNSGHPFWYAVNPHWSDMGSSVPCTYVTTRETAFCMQVGTRAFLMWFCCHWV
jgi:hypothetical protein